MRRALLPAFVLTFAVAGLGAARPAAFKWPPWLSVEAPVNPFDATARDAVFLVHAAVREGRTSVGDITASAEGLVNGKRQSMPLRVIDTGRPDTYAVRRQWPSEGTWLVRVTLLRHTTVLVTMARDGNVASVTVPTTRSAEGMPLPRTVAARDIDTMLAAAAAQP
ncbi:MAG TPA: hypothetical protein VFK13_13190 [Gemmatimonadaceae bacterium]|nr:hypothetical protein [Gemmatimonadaceae bacterium]